MVNRVTADQKIRNALIELLPVKQFHKITVTDIIKTADINRSTYYYHYFETVEILDEVIDIAIEDLVDKMKKDINDSIEHPIGRVPLPSALIMFKHISEHQRYYTSLLKSDVSNRFTFKFVDEIREFNNYLTVEFDNPTDVYIDKHMYSNYYAYAAFGQVQYWVESGFEQSPEYMAEQLTNFVYISASKIIQN